MTSVQRRKKREVAKRLRKKLRRRVLAAFPEVDNDVFKPTVKLINNIIFLDLNIRKETCISTILSMAEFFYGKTFGHGKTFRYGKELRKCGTIYFYKRPITART